jgi:phosphoesterase RecJ-like protein
MTTPELLTSTDLDAVVEALRAHDRFLVATHESPDGDALGSLLAATLALRRLGKDVRMVLGGDAPVPSEYAFLPLAELLREPPADLEGRVLLALDCANARRLGPDQSLLARAALVVDVDHHHDNSRFGAINLVVADASSTAEIVGDLLDALELPLDAEVAEALYVGLVTDTGRFQYEATCPEVFALAAELSSFELPIAKMSRQLFEEHRFEYLRLISTCLGRAQLDRELAFIATWITADDFASHGVGVEETEGLIDLVRRAQEAEVACVLKETEAGVRVSLRSVGDVDVSAIATHFGGGGHAFAAGFTAAAPLDRVLAEIREVLVAVRATAGERR